jgi:hypothetical protein
MRQQLQVQVSREVPEPVPVPESERLSVPESERLSVPESEPVLVWKAALRQWEIEKRRVKRSGAEQVGELASGVDRIAVQLGYDLVDFPRVGAIPPATPTPEPHRNLRSTWQ